MIDYFSVINIFLNFMFNFITLKNKSDTSMGLFIHESD